MNKLIFPLFLLLLFIRLLPAQNFIEVPSLPPPFDGVEASSIAFSDVDGDGDEDVLITGRNSSEQIIAKLYTNNGMGTFTEVTGTPFDGFDDGSIAFSDVDGDGDQDVLITGWNNSSQRIAKLYTNNGMGTFTEVTGTPFEGVYFSSIAFSDVDGDGDEDVLITGLSDLGRIAKLYTNNGMGTFTEVIGTPFNGVDFSSIAFSDVDGDGDEDLLITGQNSSSQRIAKLYTNNGPLAGEQCGNAIDVSNLFGQEANVPQTSQVYDNTDYDAEGDPDFGFDCFFEATNPNHIDPPLNHTIFFRFTGDGNRYRIAAPPCNAENPIFEFDTQIALYAGNCSNLAAVACNDDIVNSRVAAVEFTAVAGQEYLFLVDGYSGLESGSPFVDPKGQFCLEVTNLGTTSTIDIQQTAFTVYPNPTTGPLVIDQLRAEQVSVFDLRGSRLADFDRPGDQIDISNLPTGVYVLRMLGEDGRRYAARVIKE